MLGGVLLSCSEGARETEPAVLRAWDPLTVAQQPAGAKKSAVGEECTTTGRLGCGEGVCLHIEPHANRGYICSRTCTVDDACPENWGCRSMVPGDVISHCVPPKGWAARVAIARRVASTARVPPPPTLPPLPVGRMDGGQR